jgi:hypothetical protein
MFSSFFWEFSLRLWQPWWNKSSYSAVFVKNANRQVYVLHVNRLSGLRKTSSKVSVERKEWHHSLMRWNAKRYNMNNTFLLNSGLGSNYLLTYLLNYFLTYLLTCLLPYLLSYLLTTYFLSYLLSYFLTFLLTYFLTYLFSYFLIYLITSLLTFLLT